MIAPLILAALGAARAFVDPASGISVELLEGSCIYYPSSSTYACPEASAQTDASVTAMNVTGLVAVARLATGTQGRHLTTISLFPQPKAGEATADRLDELIRGVLMGANSVPDERVESTLYDDNRLHEIIEVDGRLVARNEMHAPSIGSITFLIPSERGMVIATAVATASAFEGLRANSTAIVSAIHAPPPASTLLFGAPRGPASSSGMSWLIAPLVVLAIGALVVLIIWRRGRAMRR